MPAGRLLWRGVLCASWVLATLTLPGVGAEAQKQPGRELFSTGDRCMACHNGLVTPSGEDMSMGFDWRASIMANSARDPYWQASVRREILDHPESRAKIEDTCATCHMPMARAEARAAGLSGSVFQHLATQGPATRSRELAADGVSCTACHQIQPDSLGNASSFDGGFVIDTARRLGERTIFGPFHVDSGRTRIMQSASEFRPAEASHLQRSEMCATCHTLFTHTLGSGGQVIGELPEQTPFLEWRASAFANERTCQSCHMPAIVDSVAISAVLGQPRGGIGRHVFQGGNAFMLRMLGKYAGELGVQALPEELEASARRTEEHLATSTARLAIERGTVASGRLSVEVAIENLAGHKLPTAYPSRRAWLHVTVLDGAGAVVFESGALRPSGEISGNNNDADGARFETHYRTIDRADQVQIYETIMLDQQGAVTTGLLSGLRYAKDNRILPRGFDRATAPASVAVHGDAAEDADFLGGGDRVGYVVDVTRAQGPFIVRAELLYQSIAYRWAQNLKPYDSPETKRFVTYYDAMATRSATVLASGETTVR